MIVCPSCSNESPDDSAFCGFCGHKFNARGPRKTLFAFKPVLKAPGGADDAPSDADASSETGSPPAAAVGGPRLTRRRPPAGDAGGDVDTDWATLNLMSLPSLESIGSKRARASEQKAREAIGAPGSDTERTASVDPRTMPHSRDAVAAVPDVGPTEVDLGRGVSSAADLREGVAAGGEARLKSGQQGKVAGGEPSVVADASLDDEAHQQRAAAEKKQPDRNTTFVMEGPQGGDIPAAGHDKQDEKSFFGASLSQHGMAPVEEATPARGGGKTFVFIAIGALVVGAIVAAVVLLAG